MPEIEVRPQYASINAVADICEPWIDLWGGDEWGESMSALHSACHTSYGFSDEDCALFASRLINNLIATAPDSYEYSGGFWGYGWDGTDGRAALEQTRAKCQEAREYWLSGGNMGCWGTSAEDAKHVIDQMPSWLFEEQDYERLPDE